MSKKQPPRYDFSDEVEAPDIDPAQLPAPKFVGTGIKGFIENPDNPQEYLEGSNHPYAPFPGNALKWESFVFDDGTAYEGLMREGVPHMKGVLIIGNGTGGGLNPEMMHRGDKYEGEFSGGFAEGLGMHSAQTGEVYKGQYAVGKRHGCGALYNLGPFQRLVAQGVEPDKAWERVKQRISDRTVFGRWEEDERVDRAPAEFGRPCSIPEIKLMLDEVDSVVTRARMFTHKPDGQVAILKLQDAGSIPIPVMQDPLHYPHGTKFLAPGPLGQCHPIPDDAKLKDQMRLHARNAVKIHDAYNLPYQVLPGSDLDKAVQLALRQQARDQELYESETDAEQRRLERFARLRQKRAGGMRGGWRPEANSLGVDAATLHASRASSTGSTAPSTPGQISEADGIVMQRQPQQAAGPFAGLRKGVQGLGGAAAGAVQQLQGFAAARLGHRGQQER